MDLTITLRILCFQEKSPVLFEYGGPQKRSVPCYPFSIVSQGGGNLSSQSLQTRPQAHGDVARQDRQSKYNVTVRRVRIAIVAVEQQ